MLHPQSFVVELIEKLEQVFHNINRLSKKGSIQINAHYPNRWKSGTPTAHLYGCCVNNPKGIQHHPSFPRFLFAHGNGRYKLYDPAKHGSYDKGFSAGEQPQLADDQLTEQGKKEISALHPVRLAPHFGLPCGGFMTRFIS